MRIAFIITRADDLGGAQIHVRDLSAALLGLGHEPVVLAGSRGILADQLAERGVPFYFLRHLTHPIRPVRDLRALWELRSKLGEIQPDIISTHAGKAGVLGRIAGRLLRIPILTTAHGWRFPLPTSRWLRWTYWTIEKAAAPLAARIITVCESDRQLAIRSRIAKDDQLVTIHNALPDVDRTLRAQPGRTPTRIVMVARFSPQKDHRTLIRALRELTSLDWQLDLLGTGPLQASVVEQVNSHGITSRVRFLGLRQDVPQLLAQAQLFLLITNWEGFPRSILEALRCGLPVIASDVGGVREAVLENKTGFLVPRGDVHCLRDRVETLITDAALRVKMGAAGRALFEQRFTFDRLLERTMSLYEATIPSGRGKLELS